MRSLITDRILPLLASPIELELRLGASSVIGLGNGVISIIAERAGELRPVADAGEKA